MVTIETEKVQPTAAQVETFDHVIEMWKDADVTLLAEMDEDGTMLLHLTEDGATTHARFAMSGCLMGDWF